MQLSLSFFCFLHEFLSYAICRRPIVVKNQGDWIEGRMEESKDEGINDRPETAL